MAEIYRVLCVEDELEQAEMVREYLRLSGPFETDWAPNIQTLWERISSNHYDILLMDFKLPDGTGLRALEELHRRGIDTPVVMITGQGDERLAVQAMQLGASDYLIKGSEDILRLPSLVQKTIRAHQLQQSIEKSLEHIRYQALLLNNVRDAVVVWNTEGKITYWNPAAEGLYGIKSRDRVGELVDGYLNAFAPAVKIPPREGTWGMEIERQFQKPGEEVIWVSSRVSALNDYGANGRLIGYMDVARDITGRKHMETSLKDAQAHLAKNARLAAIGELASGVAHHINNPLTTIIAEAQLLRPSLPADHPGRESVDLIEDAGWRVQKTVQKLIDFSKPNTSSIEELQINETIQNALNLVGDQIISSGVKLQQELAPGLPRMRGNARQLCDLWVNLLMLAHDATTDGQPHKISVCSRYIPGIGILVDVGDDGTLIPPEDIQQLFEPDMIKTYGGRGTGIELNICQEIVRQHQGEIQAMSNPDLGTVFNVFFPLEADYER
jgi:two-component system cell cycle sensor histidine kinase/response regulator CckA